MKIDKVAMIGAGSWGTALALVLARKNIRVALWDRDADHIANLVRDRENKRHQPDHPFPESLEVTGDLGAAVQGAGCVVMVVPSHGYRAVFRELWPQLTDGTLVVSAVKGIEVDSGMTMTEIMTEENKGRKRLHFCVLSGPSFAAEVADCQPTAVTAACVDLEVAEQVQQLFAAEYFRVYAASDVKGLEISSAMKNVIAIGAGICDGLGYGLNTRAALITRGLAEITRMGVAMGAEPQTFAGLGGLGDLVLTCTGDLSRNRTVGLKLGSGLTLEEVLAQMTMVAEGVKTTRSCYHLAHRLGVEMPILEQMYQVLYNGKRCEDAVRDLFQRGLKKEND